jgi:hypothetical protein
MADIKYSPKGVTRNPLTDTHHHHLDFLSHSSRKLYNPRKAIFVHELNSHSGTEAGEKTNPLQKLIWFLFFPLLWGDDDIAK